MFQVGSWLLGRAGWAHGRASFGATLCALTCLSRLPMRKRMLDGRESGSGAGQGSKWAKNAKDIQRHGFLPVFKPLTCEIRRG